MKRFIQNLFSSGRQPPALIHIYYQTKDGPWGGGNQFLKAMKKSLIRRGCYTNNPEKASHILFNSHHDIYTVQALKNDHPDKTFMHRIDGPIFLVRGKDKEIDDKIFALNSQLADVSVFQSQWSLQETLALGYHPVNPTVILNAADHRIFNRKNKLPFSQDRKIKIVSTSWSDNARKGGAVYKWLDENLDWDKYSYTFVGRVREDLHNIHLQEPVNSKQLAKILKQHDIYITASDKDPCSNALVEAISCGLPAVYYHRGGHPEIVKEGGLGYEHKEEIPPLLDEIVSHYHRFQQHIPGYSIDHASEQYVSATLLK